MRAVLVLRPEPGNAATCTAARALGLDPVAIPLFAYAPRTWHLPHAGPWDGLLIGSAAVFGHGGAGLAALRTVPVHAVGRTTARAAQAAGFIVARTGSGGLQSLVSTLPPGRYLRLAGEAHVALDPPTGVAIDDVIVYAAVPQPLPPAMVRLIAREPALALLHSAQAALHFGEQCALHAIPRERIMLACIAPRVAAAVGTGWQAVGVCTTPDDDAMLSLARQMCQTV
jgi:uroporphyrinogen-III synthase